MENVEKYVRRGDCWEIRKKTKRDKYLFCAILKHVSDVWRCLENEQWTKSKFQCRDTIE